MPNRRDAKSAVLVGEPKTEEAPGQLVGAGAGKVLRYNGDFMGASVSQE